MGGWSPAADGARSPATGDPLAHVEDLRALDPLLRRDIARRARHITVDDVVGEEVTRHPVLVQRGIVAVLGRDGRAQDLLGPGRLRAPNPTTWLEPLGPVQLLALPLDLVDATAHSVPTAPGARRWATSFAALRSVPGVVVDRELPAHEVGRRLDAVGATAAAVTGLDVTAAVGRAGLEGVGGRPVGELAVPAPPVDVDAPAVEVLAALVIAGVPIAPLVSGEVPVAAVDIEAFPLPVGHAARTVCCGTDTGPQREVALARSAPLLAAELLDAGAEASEVARAYSSVVARSIAAVVGSTAADEGELPAPYAWLAFGSLARGEALPDSDLDTGLAWGTGGMAAEARFATLALQVTQRLQALGYRIDPGGVSAVEPEWRHDLDGWRAVVGEWTDPLRRHGLIGAGVAADVVTIAGDLDADELLRAAIATGVATSAAMASLAADAVRQPAPAVLGRTGAWRFAAARRRLDLKRDVIGPIVELARVHTLARGGEELATLERLTAAARSEQLRPALALTLREGYDLALRVRLARSVGRAPPVLPAELGPALAPAIRGLARAQQGLRARYAVR